MSWCTGCHSSDLQDGARQNAPLGINFDSLEGIREHRELILERAVNRGDMPPAGGPSRARAAAARGMAWLRRAAESDGLRSRLRRRMRGVRRSRPAPAPSLDNLCRHSVLPRCSAATRSCVELCPHAIRRRERDRGLPRSVRRRRRDAERSGDGRVLQRLRIQRAPRLRAARGCADQTAFLVLLHRRLRPKGRPRRACRRSCADDIQAFGYCVGYGPTECASFTRRPQGALLRRLDPWPSEASGLVDSSVSRY